MKLTSTFCVEPFGDSVSRKSFFETIMLGCIPVVQREDDLYVDQMPFSHTIPYRQLWVAIPPGKDLFSYLRTIKRSEILRRRRVIKDFGRSLTYSSTSSKNGGYNDFRNPYAFASALKEVWDRSRQNMTECKPRMLKPWCESSTGSPAACRQTKKGTF